MPNCPKGLTALKGLKREDVSRIRTRKGSRIPDARLSFPGQPPIDRRDIAPPPLQTLATGLPSRGQTLFEVLNLVITERQLRRFLKERKVQKVLQPGIPIKDIVTPAVIPRVRSRPDPEPGSGLPPALTPQLFKEANMAVHKELIDRFLDLFDTDDNGNGTVVEFPSGDPRVAADDLSQFIKKPKRRRRRRRLLTASDKCDIAAMKAMLSSAEFKIWLACPSMFKG